MKVSYIFIYFCTKIYMDTKVLFIFVFLNYLGTFESWTTSWGTAFVIRTRTYMVSSSTPFAIMWTTSFSTSDV